VEILEISEGATVLGPLSCKFTGENEKQKKN
jgi:hypothetical protein